MNKIISLLVSALLLAGLTFYSSCKSDDSGPSISTSPQQLVTELLVNGSPWSGSSATGPNGSSNDFDNFSITWTATTYTSSGGLAGVWDDTNNGQWTFTSTDENDASTITRADGVEVSITVSETELVLSFTIDGGSGGRTSGVAGLEGNWSITCDTGS